VTKQHIHTPLTRHCRTSRRCYNGKRRRQTRRDERPAHAPRTQGDHATAAAAGALLRLWHTATAATRITAVLATAITMDRPARSLGLGGDDLCCGRGCSVGCLCGGGAFADDDVEDSHVDDDEEDSHVKYSHALVDSSPWHVFVRLWSAHQVPE
jgi:hypothetical protein